MTFLFRHPFRLIKRLLSFGAYLIQTVWKFLCLRRHGPLSHRARSAWLHESAQQLAEKLRLRVQVSGRIPDHGLITSNHLSYLDIVAIASVAPSIFVSKNEVRYWPVIGLLSTWAGTLYLKRQRRADDDTGLLAEPDDIDSLTAKLTEALTDRERLRQIAARGREEILATHDVRRSAAAVVQHIEDTSR